MPQELTERVLAPDRWTLLRDLFVLQFKLVVDGMRDFLLVPASLIAGIISLLSATMANRVRISIGCSASASRANAGSTCSVPTNIHRRVCRRHSRIRALTISCIEWSHSSLTSTNAVA